MNDRELLKRSPLFDSEFYRTQYRDVDMIGMDPIEHYLWMGWKLSRDPSFEFSTTAYLKDNPDIAHKGKNPLVHYERHGRREKRKVQLSSQYILKLREMRKRAEADQQTRVSIIMPAYNREATIARSIESVVAQTYRNWELLIVDDGSTDKTAEVVQKYLSDRRVHLLKGPHTGVSAARNVGLKAARSPIIAYLDSDNVWFPHYLGKMVGFMTETKSDVAYAQDEVVNDTDRVIRGQPFDGEKLLKGNYIDLNVYCHTRHLYVMHGGFDEKLRRMVDWDLIIRQTMKASKIGYAPFVGCEYTNTETDKNRISVKEFRAFRRVVVAKAKADGDRSKIAENISLNFAIKVPAPYEKRQEWGDFHYADSLAGSLTRMGHKVRIDFHGKWDRPRPEEDDVVIAIRGLTQYKPLSGHINILWNISHPDQISFEEYESFDVAYIASLSYAAFLKATSNAKAKALLQATDVHRFNPTRKAPEVPADILFVGNSRNEYRDIVRWAVAEKVDLSVYGTRWEQFIPSAYIKGTNVPNKELGGHYHSARMVLNDHWPSMRDFGFISNRIFDVLSAGGIVVSDRVPAISYVFGDAVKQISSQEDLAKAVKNGHRVDHLALSQDVSLAHSFDHRAKTILSDIYNLLAIEHAPMASPFVPRGKKMTVNAVVRQDREFPQSSAFIRLLCPLTTDLAFGEVDFQLVPARSAVDSRRADVTIVQRTAFDTLEEAQALLAQVRTRGSKLITDNDDAFCYLDEEHAEFDLYRPRIAGLDLLLDNADANWVSTDVLRDAYSHLAKKPIVMENAIDPRLWRDYRRPPAKKNEVPTLVYAGTATHDADFEMIAEALDQVAQNHQFKLTIIGAVRNPPKRDWIKVLPPPRTAQSYPHFVRWFREQGPFDLGLAPLKSNRFNDAKSDLKLLDYGALGILPVVSKGPSYSQTVSRSGGGVLVDNTVEAWASELSRLIGDLETGADARTAAERYCYEDRNVTNAYSNMRASLFAI